MSSCERNSLGFYHFIFLLFLGHRSLINNFWKLYIYSFQIVFKNCNDHFWNCMLTSIRNVKLYKKCVGIQCLSPLFVLFSHFIFTPAFHFALKIVIRSPLFALLYSILLIISSLHLKTFSEHCFDWMRLEFGSCWRK